MNKSIPVILLSILLSMTTLTSWGYFDEEVPSLPAVTYVPDMIVVNFEAQIRGIQPTINNGVVMIGEPTLDQLAIKYDVNYIEKEFPGCTIPFDPDEVDLSGYYKIQFNPAFSLEEVIRAYEANPFVEHVEKIGICPIFYVPNDPMFNLQWGLHQSYDHDIDAPEAWDLERDNNTPIVAIADTGVDWEHPDLGDNIWMNPDEILDGIDNDGNGLIDDIRGWDWVHGVSGVPGEDTDTPDNDPSDYNGHGTHVAGIAGAVTDNGTGVAGTTFNARIMALRIGWSGYYGSYEVGYVRMDFAAQSLYYAADKEAIAYNASWGSSNSGGISAAVTYAVSHGVVICTAAGNDNSQTPHWLANHDDTIAVAGTTNQDLKWSGSNYGTWVDCCAPCKGIVSTYQVHGGPHNYGNMTGTSMAAPFACGIIALLNAYKPYYDWDELHDTLLASCDNIDDLNPGYEGKLGSGRVNAYNCLTHEVDVELIYFEAHSTTQGALLKWAVDITGEDEVLGYNLYRREMAITTQEIAAGDLSNRTAETKVNEALITGENPYSFLDATVEEDNWYIYRLEAIKTEGAETLCSTEFCLGSNPASFTLAQNFPNPADGPTTIKYSLPDGVTFASLLIHDLTGRLVREVPLSNEPGPNQVVWDGTDSFGSRVSGGVYIYSLKTDVGTKSRKLVLVR